MKLNKRKIQISITIISFIFIIAHLIFPSLNIDAITLGLFIVAILPWLSPLFKSITIPGLGQFDFAEEIKDVSEKILANEKEDLTITIVKSNDSYLPNYGENIYPALIVLRVEIEKRLQKMALFVDSKYQPKGINSLIRFLVLKKVFDENVAKGLQNLVSVLNNSVHGVEVSPEDTVNAINQGNNLLKILDAKLLMQHRKNLASRSIQH